jgi:hypothetical protein
MNTSIQSAGRLPYKSVAGALLFGVFLGPLGLLYGSYWGGFMMIFITLYMVKFKFYFLLVLCWLVSCIWNVGAVETHNKKILTYS